MLMTVNFHCQLPGDERLGLWWGTSLDTSMRLVPKKARGSGRASPEWGLDHLMDCGLGLNKKRKMKRWAEHRPLPLSCFPSWLAERVMEGASSLMLPQRGLHPSATVNCFCWALNRVNLFLVKLLCVIPCNEKSKERVPQEMLPEQTEGRALPSNFSQSRQAVCREGRTSPESTDRRGAVCERS